MHTLTVAVLVVGVCVLARCAVAEPIPQDVYKKYRAEVEDTLQHHVLDVWFPACVDERGFRSELTADWKPQASKEKFSVFQGRMTWIAAQVAAHRPGQRERFLPIARHGLDFL